MIVGELKLNPQAKTIVERFPNIFEQAMAGAIKFWHNTLLPIHFTMSAYRRYHYKWRSEAYNKRKKRKYGHTLPLVLTGRVGKQALERIDISGSSRVMHGRLKFFADAYYIYKYRPNQPKKVEEMVRLLKSEEDLLRKYIAAQVINTIREVYQGFRFAKMSPFSMRPTRMSVSEQSLQPMFPTGTSKAERRKYWNPSARYVRGELN